MMDSDATLTIFLTVTADNGARIPLNLALNATPKQLRQKASEATKIPLGSLRLIFRGRMIKDDETTKVVVEYKLDKDCVIHCMGKPDNGATPAAPSPVAAGSSAALATGSTVSIQPGSANAAGPTASSNVDPLPSAIATMRSSNHPPAFLLGINTFVKVLNNIVSNPMEEKFRRVKKQNPAFQKRLGGLIGADAAMKAAGFVMDTHDGDEVYMMHASADAWPKLMAAKATVEAAARDAQAANQGAPAPQVQNNQSFPMPGGMPGSGLPGFGGMSPGGAGMDSNMQNAMAGLMSDPDALRTMLQNPTVQQMIQNDPNVPPMLRQSIEQLASNPAMLNQLSQMMRDPMMRSRIQNMVGNNPGAMGMGGAPGFGGAMGGFGGGAPIGANANSNVPSQQQNSGASTASDQDQTEEEMIAEAIRRSLEEG